MTRFSLALLAALFLPACYQADIIGGKPDAAPSDASQTSSDPCVDSPASYEEMGGACADEGHLCAEKKTIDTPNFNTTMAVCVAGKWNFCPHDLVPNSMPGCPCGNFFRTCEYGDPAGFLVCSGSPYSVFSRSPCPMGTTCQPNTQDVYPYCQ